MQTLLSLVWKRHQKLNSTISSSMWVAFIGERAARRHPFAGLLDLLGRKCEQSRQGKSCSASSWNVTVDEERFSHMDQIEQNEPRPSTLADMMPLSDATVLLRLWFRGTAQHFQSCKRITNNQEERGLWKQSWWTTESWDCINYKELMYLNLAVNKN